MSVPTQIRILLLDDLSELCALDTPPFMFSGVDTDDEAIYERNFSLSWIYEREQIKRYYYTARNHLGRRHPQLAGARAYPNLVIFDYDLGDIEKTYAVLRDEAIREIYENYLDPIRTVWGGIVLPANLGAYLGPTAQAAESAARWFALPENKPMSARDGCYGGSFISLLFSGAACAGIPQTVATDDAFTNFVEWMLDIQLADAFANKRDTRSGGAAMTWWPILEQAIPRLRVQILSAVSKGTITPVLEDLLNFAQHCESPPDPAILPRIRLSSELGLEMLPIEGLFFELLYCQDSKNRLQLRKDAAFADALTVWVSDMLRAALGQASRDEVAQALSFASQYVAAYTSTEFEIRKRVSHEVCGESNNEARDSAIQKYESVLLDWGVDIGALAKAPLDAEIGVHNASNARKALNVPKILPQLDKLSDSGSVERYTAIALLVWCEMIWHRISSRDAAGLQNGVQQIAELLLDYTLYAGETKWERIEANAGLTYPYSLYARLELLRENNKIGDESDAEWREVARALGQHTFMWRTMYGYFPPPSNDGEIAPQTYRPPYERKELVSLVKDVMAPSPKTVALWRELGPNKGTDTHIRTPLSRLGGGKLVLGDILSGKHQPDGGFGLAIGEGRLVELFALHYGFERQHWPDWMNKGANL